MDRNSDIELEETWEDLDRDREQMKKVNTSSYRRKTRNANRPKKPYLIYFVLVVLILLIVYLLFRGGDETPKQNLDPLWDKFAQFEKKLAEIENQGEEFRQRVSELDQAGTTLSQRIDGLGEKLEQIKKEKAPSKATTTAKSSSLPKTPPKPKTQSYEISKGDTLYGIAKKFGVTLDELRRLNGFSRNKAIYPGQKILVPLKD
jgi:LysM repeat protein